MAATGSEASRRIATVIVARRVRPGSETPFAAWMEEMRAAVQAQPGFLSAEFQPPDELHPDEWVVTFQFEDGTSLAAWLGSEERLRLTATGEALVEGDPRQQVLAVGRPTVGRPVTAVVSARVRPGSEPAYRAVYDDVAAVMATVEGFLQAELFEAVHGLQHDTVIVFSFDSLANLDAWMTSATRAELIRRFDPLIEGPRHVNVVGGFAGWFTTGETASVKGWKQFLAVVGGLFPVSLAVTVVRNRFAPGLPLVPAVLAGNVVGSAAMTYAVMPWVNRTFGTWLSR